MADRIYASMHRVEGASPQSDLDAAATGSRSEQLVPRDDSVLSRSEFSGQPIQAALGPILPAFATYRVVNAGRIAATRGHPERMKRGSARVAREMSILDRGPRAEMNGPNRARPDETPHGLRPAKTGSSPPVPPLALIP